MRCPRCRSFLLFFFAKAVVEGANFDGCVADVAKALPYCDMSLPVEKRLDDLVSRMTLDEKVAQITPQPEINQCAAYTRGKDEIGLPGYLWLVETNSNVASGCLQEGHCATTFAGPTGLGATFNRTVWRMKGSVLGSEMRALSNLGASRFTPGDAVKIGLTGYGPNLNIIRDPRFGRNSELPSEDPFLSGTYGYEMVSGMQERDSHNYPKLAAFLKHYTAYSTEENRGHDSYVITPYDFSDTYLAQYERAFAAQPAGVMCSYNGENGVPSCANAWLLNTKLRSWKPDAMVSTDCGAIPNLRGAPVNAQDDVHAAAYALMNGTDLEMGEDLFRNLPAAILQGLATEGRVDEAVKRTFRVHFELGRFDPQGASDWDSLGLETINHTLHQRVSYEAALQSLVLLKNDGVLPISSGRRVAVLGPEGVSREGLLEDYAADQTCFGGYYHCIATVAEGIARANIGGETMVAQGVDVNSNRTDGIDLALGLAAAADVIVLVLGSDRMLIEHEGQDRIDTALPGLQEAFALKVIALGKPTVVVLTNGGALAIDNLMEPSTLQQPYAIVESFRPGVLGGLAIGNALFGRENRWGKMPMTMYPHSFIHQKGMTDYDMSSGVGRTYKYYRGAPLFPFGYGLSLTTFDFDCKLSSVLRDPLSFSCLVNNTGNREGDEVIQVYHVARGIGPVDHPLPLRSLIDFERVSIEAGVGTQVEFKIPLRQLRLVNKVGDRVLYPGNHTIFFSRGHGAEQSIHIKVLDMEPIVI